MPPITPYQTIRVPDLGAGIDAESAENAIQPGWAENIVNADPQPSGYIQTRRGYQGYGGNIPVRVTEVHQTGTDLELTLDTSIDLSNIRSQPLVIQGMTSNSTGGDFPNTGINTHYYSGFTDNIAVPFATGTHTDIVLGANHGITTPIIWTGIAKSTSVVNTSNTQIFADDISVNKVSHNISYTYINGTGSSFDGFIFPQGQIPTAGDVYNSPLTTINTGINTYTVLAATHLLKNHNIIVKVFQDTGAAYDELVPDAVIINDLTGTVSITINNGTGSSFSAIFSLVSTDTANFHTGNIGGSGTVSINIDITNQSPFLFIGSYLKNGTNFEQVIPDSIVVDTNTKIATVTLQNSDVVGKIFNIFWKFAFISTNSLHITATNAATINDLAPQLTIWGLDHAEIYGTDKNAREGWSTHIDSYRAAGENRLITGLGGNIFSNQFAAEGNNAVIDLMPTLYPNVNASVNGEVTIGPAFYDTGETPQRTRGFITADIGATNYFSVISVTYNTGTTYTDYLLDVPNMAINGSISTIISTIAPIRDKLTVTQCGWSFHNGSYDIVAVTVGTNQLTISVVNSNVTGSDYDEANSGGSAGIFTDQIPVSGSIAPAFLPNDILLSGIFDAETDNFVVIASAYVSGSAIILANNIVTEVALPSTLRVTGQRTSNVIPLRDFSNNQSVLNLVRGDMLSYTEIARQLRIKSINISSNQTIATIDNNTDTTALVTVSSGDTSSLLIGASVLIFGTTYFNGSFIIDNIISNTEFTIQTTETNTDSGGYVQGHTIEIDENLTFNDTETSTVSISVVSRWIPIEFPGDSFDLTPKTRISYFQSNPYSNQPIIRSSMVKDNMYLTNGSDEVFKFDGTNIYRAGLFRWQPNLFVTLDSVTAGKITINNPSVATTAVSSNNRFTIALDNQNVFTVGDLIQHSLDSNIYTVRNLTVDNSSAPTVGYVYVDRIISNLANGGTLTRISEFKYYFRLNAVDANNNITASAVAGSDDFVTQLGTDAAARIRLVGMPAWDIYDYDRLEVQIYRTKSNQPAPFYLLTTLPMAFDQTSGYIDYVDAASDSDLIQLDDVNTALKGAELGTAWEEPIRAKYVTSADNRLILANVQDYPQLDIQFLRNYTDITRAYLLTAGYTRWLFLKDDTDTTTTTDMVNRVAYEFRDVTTANAIAGITQTFNTFQVNSIGHGLSPGNWVYLFHDGSAANLNVAHAGWWQVHTIVDANNFVVNSRVIFPVGVTVNVTKMLRANNLNDIPVPIGDDYNYGMLNGNRDLGILTAVSTIPYEFIAMRRLCDAINASMRKTDVSLTSFASFKPWMIAAAGNEFGVGHLQVKQPKAGTLNLGLKLPALTSNIFNVFVNSIARSGNTIAGALTKQFPSRVLLSYTNFPEIFDAPTAALDADSDSAIDVNSADGQEITAVIPFFGTTAFGAALKGSVIVVFKTYSIYIINPDAKAQGTAPVQRLETRGQGCTAPYSVSLTRSGILFANETGIYRLNTDLSLDYIGRKYERQWKQNVNKNELSLATGTNDINAYTYKLSYPISTDTENSLVAVYNHNREEEIHANQPYATARGAWSTYDSHPTTGWTNLLSNSYFGSTNGRVFWVRRLNDNTDYRDDSSPINVNILIGATDFGDGGKRKFIKYVTTHYRALTDSIGTSLSTAIDLSDSFHPTDTFKILKNTITNGLSDTGSNKVVSIQSSLGQKKGIYIQLLYTNSTIDEPIAITGIDYSVTGLSERGIKQAATTNR